MMNKFYPATFILLASLCASVAAEQKHNSKLEVGVDATSGNSETQSFIGNLEINHEMTSWKNQYRLEGLLKRSSNQSDDEETSLQTTAKKYFASVRADYKINKKHVSFFMYSEYERSLFSGFDYQYTLALGYANRVFTTDRSYLGYSVGPGVTVNRPETPNATPSPEKENNFVVRVTGEYLYQFSENAEFTHKLSSNVPEDSDRNTKTKSVTAISAKLNSFLALSASYTIDYNSVVAEGRKHADILSALKVVYSF